MKSSIQSLISTFDPLDRATITPQFSATAHIMTQLLGGDHPEIVILSKDAVQTLISENPLWINSIDLAATEIGVAMKPGLEKPVIDDSSDFQTFLLQASSIGYTTDGISGVYMTKLVQELGLGEKLASKTKLIKGGLAGELIVSGQVDFVIQNISELMAVKGIEMVGKLPEEVQLKTIFSAALSQNGQKNSTALKFWQLLDSDQARALYETHGLTNRLIG